MPAGAKPLSGKYDAPATRKAAATRAVQEGTAGGPLPERVLWDALDAGADPTDPADTRSAAPGDTPDTPGTHSAAPGNISGAPGSGENRPGTAGKAGPAESGDAP
ncbi:Trp biosynthesis-associated membrane protein [Nocardia zapadnayensis]|nr:Trp biosynthesis-associated membrane protein [Nocardia zapadnayensis]MCX0274427.1 Trp biosynthesis-associated membrane protein [Nocardia zapadnayensis]